MMRIKVRQHTACRLDFVDEVVSSNSAAKAAVIEMARELVATRPAQAFAADG